MQGFMGKLLYHDICNPLLLSPPLSSSATLMNESQGRNKRIIVVAENTGYLEPRRIKRQSNT